MNPQSSARGLLPGRGWILLIALLPLAALLFYFGSLGWFSRYIADDFCTAGWLNELGFLGSQAYWRGSWSGRFSFFFTINILHLLGAWVPRILPAVLIFACSVGLYLLANKLSAAFALEATPGPSVAFALVVPATALASTPNLYQSLLWQTGALTYLLPLVLLTFQIAWLLHWATSKQPRQGKLPLLLAMAGLAVITGGFSETIAAVQLVLHVGILVLNELDLWPGQRAASRRQAGVVFVGGLIALVIIISAPGNSVRQGLLGPASRLDRVVLRSVYDTYLLAARVYRHELIWALTAFLVPLLGSSIWLGDRQPAVASSVRALGAHWWGYLLALPLLTLALVITTMAPSEYALASYPDGRVLISAHYWIMLGLSLWGGLLGAGLAARLKSQSLAWPLAAGLLIFIISTVAFVSFVAGTKPLRQDAMEFASAWNNRHRQLMQADRRQAPVAAASLTHMAGLDELERDPDHWVNRCVALTYGLGRVVAK